MLSKIALSLGGCPLQVFFCPRFVLGLSLLFLFVFYLSSQCLCIVLGRPKLVLKSQHIFLAKSFLNQKALGYRLINEQTKAIHTN